MSRMKKVYDLEASRVETGTQIGARIKKVGNAFVRLLGTGRRLLDVGCGVGDYTTYIGRLIGAEELFGIDIAQARVDIAKSKGIDAIVADLNSDSLPFPDHHFDAIFFGEVLEHLVDPDHALRELRRLLSPSGLLVVTTPNLTMWLNRICLTLGYQPFLTDASFEFGDAGKVSFARGRSGGTHLRVLSHRALCELLEYHRFDVVGAEGCSVFETAQGLPGRLLWLVWVLWPLDYLLSRRPSLACISVVAARRSIGV